MSTEQFIAVNKARINFDGDFSKWRFEPNRILEKEFKILYDSANVSDIQKRFTTEIVLSLQINRDGSPRGLLGGRFEVFDDQVVHLKLMSGGHNAELPNMMVGIPTDMETVIADEVEKLISDESSADLIIPCKIDLKYGMFEANYYDDTAYRLLTRFLLYTFAVKVRGLNDKDKYSLYIERAYEEILRNV